MSILSVTGLTHSFGDKLLFDDTSFFIDSGDHIGLVGANGKGKTTLFRLINGQIIQDDGKIEWNSKYTVGYLDQHTALDQYDTVKEVLESSYEALYKIEKEINVLYGRLENASQEEQERILNRVGVLQEELEKNNFYDIDYRIQEVANGMGISHLFLKNPSNLSGGQRTKILLSKLLLEKPDVLLLDEPTNYLDEVNISWLKAFLVKYEGAFVIISHDTNFVNEVVTVIYHLQNMKLTRYIGNYEKFLRVYEERKQQLVTDYTKQQAKIKKLEEYIRKNQVRTATAAQAKSRGKVLKKMVRIKLDPNEIAPNFKFEFFKESSPIVVKTTGLQIGYDKPLTRPLDFTINAGEKIILVGTNGIGKTTLLKTILSLIEPVTGAVELGDNLQIGYYAQEEQYDMEESVLNDVWGEFPQKTQSQVRAMLAKCGLLEKNIDMRLKMLSGGERAKVRLCKIMNHRSNFLVLDEPTNHLDNISKIALRKAIMNYRGTVILVSHEKDFIENLEGKVWDCSKFRV